MYKSINIFMHGVHFVIISASLFGGILKQTLILHLVLQFLILVSWLGYGLYDGRWGRCVITDIQWYFKEKHGKRPKTESFVYYWSKNKLNLGMSETTTEIWTIGLYAMTSIVSVVRYFIYFY